MSKYVNNEKVTPSGGAFVRYQDFSLVCSRCIGPVAEIRPEPAATMYHQPNVEGGIRDNYEAFHALLSGQGCGDYTETYIFRGRSKVAQPE